MTVSAHKQKKIVRFIDGVKAGEKETESKTEPRETTPARPCSGDITAGVTKPRETGPAEVNDKPSSPFLEQLLEVDKIENGHTKTSENKEDNSKHQGNSFISCRNFLAEQGFGPTSCVPYEEKKFEIRGPFPQTPTAIDSSQHWNLNQSNVYNQGLGVNTNLTRVVSQPRISHKLPSHSNIFNMSYMVGGETSQSFGTVTRLSEKEELQRLNDRLTSYVNHVRIINEQGSQVDSSAFLKTAKILEEEINNLKNIYEQELDKLRKDLEGVSRERSTLQIQSSKHQQTAVEIQDRLNVEADKNRKLMEEVASYQQQITSLDAQLHSLKMTAIKVPDNSDNIQRTVENLKRENETIKHRYDAEQVARQEAEDRIQQLMKKLEFNEQVNAQQVIELRNRVETSTGTILALEARIRELSKADASVGDLLKSVREASEAEFKKYQMESDVEYSRNISTLKTQLDSNSSTIDRLQSEKLQIEGAVGELQTRIRALEGHISSVEHQKKSLEEAITIERSRSVDNIQTLEKKLRELQDMLVVKMKEVSTAREASVPLKTEIESLKLLLEEEEKRLKVAARAPSPPLMMTREKQLPSSSYNILTSTATAPQAVTPYIPMTTTYPGAPISSTMMPDYTVPFGTTSPYDYDYSMNNIPTYLDTDPLDLPLSSMKYTYETSPSVNRLTMEPTPPDTPRGPIASPKLRAKSAPAVGPRDKDLHLVPTSMGHGKDYFDEMFNDLQRNTLATSLRPKSSPLSSTSHDYTVATSSAIGDVKILEVNQDGKYVRLINDGAQEIEFGGYMLQQNVGGHPVAVYRFPPRTKLSAQTTITVWSGMNNPILHQPPSDFVWKEQQKWGSGPECTSILCRPNGQAIAWTTAAHRFTRNAFKNRDEENIETLELAGDDDQDYLVDADEVLTELSTDAAQKQEHVYLRREKQTPPSLAAQRHPHGNSPSQGTHPHTGQARPLTYGNDNSTVSRQSRQQSTRPDPIPGQPYAGASGQRMGSAPLRKYVNPTLKGSGSIANRSAGTIRFGPPSPFLSPLQQEFSSLKDQRPSSSPSLRLSQPPSPFGKPHKRVNDGVTQFQSQQQNEYLPPMPRPPLFSAW